LALIFPTKFFIEGEGQGDFNLRNTIYEYADASEYYTWRNPNYCPDKTDI
jgi:hypothetical protein